MGCCNGTERKLIEMGDENESKDNTNVKSVNDVSHQIGKYIDANHSRVARLKKLLLLGSGSSGKTTLFKQVKAIHGHAFDQSEYAEAEHVIRSNCVLGILTLLKNSEELSHKPDIATIIDCDACKVDIEDAEIVNHIKNVLQFANETFETMSRIPDESLVTLGASIDFLWQLPQIQKTYTYKQYYSMIENMDYFLTKIQPIMQPDYHPSEDDVMLCRIRTTGIVEELYEIEHEEKQVTFAMVDVGGQRTERKKWIHSFESVTAVLFVAALNHYCTVLFEDENMNGMQESLLLFDEICNSKWFKKTAIILFLNKNDLFENSIRKCLPISICFGTIYDGPNYEVKENVEDDEDYFNYCCEEGRAFIRQQYMDLNEMESKTIYSHFTTATDKGNIEKVFWDVQTIVIQLNLFKGGLL